MSQPSPRRLASPAAALLAALVLSVLGLAPWLARPAAAAQPTITQSAAVGGIPVR